jgi:tetratricopeptide (TPR) repeat protein
MRRLPLFVLLGILCSLPAFADEGHHHDLTAQELGSVHFTVSCAKGVQKDFNRSVALLHSFQYEQARAAFSDVAKKDPGCAMAHWGVAMSWYHGLWDNTDYDAGRKAMAQADFLAAESKRISPRERQYIAALDEIYKQDGRDAAAHNQAFAEKMAALHASNPGDVEAAIFHALALAITAPKTDKTFANQRRCGEILEPIFQKQPHHPGAAHYLIHCYDNPVLAERALPAARAYAKIAPASAHAHHMPSHIFTRVGSWDEAIASDTRSAQVATDAERTSPGGEARDQRLHAMDYLEYAYLQSGRVQRAKAVLDELRALPPLPGRTMIGNYASEAIPARYALERGDWEAAKALQADASAVPWAQALTWLAVGVGGARSGDLARARQAEQALAALRDKAAEMKNPYWSKQVEVQRREVAAWMAQQEGRREEAVATMRSAAELEESMEKHPVTPGVLTPAREMLAELLALQKQPQPALREYQAVLKVAPNRFNALYGAATAAEAAGDPATATSYYRKLLQVAVGEERPELREARKRSEIAAK